MDIKQYANMMTKKVNKQKYTEAPMLFINLLKKILKEEKEI